MGVHAASKQHEQFVAAWEACGAMALSGRPDGPGLGPPAPLVPRLRALGERLARFTDGAAPDPFDLLTERAAILGFTRHGDVSCGGSTRLLRARDGWLAVTLARDDDVAAVPAWLELDGEPRDVWAAVDASVAELSAASAVDRASLLGLPVSQLPDAPRPVRGVQPFADLPLVAAQLDGEAPPRTRTRSRSGPRSAQLNVVDLGSLWAGPLCGRLIRLAGAHVVKAESRTRPDGARSGTPAFYERMNEGKEHAQFDLDERGAAELRGLLASADVVIEASRPRALRQLGILAEELLTSAGGPTVWVSITGYGRTGDPGMRVAFGDDAAVGGGLVVRDGEGPCFCADAIADPLTGIVAALGALTALESGRRWLLDVAMAGVATHFAGPTLAA